METRRAYPTVFYNGKNISTTVDKYLESFQYTDPASGESDSLSLSLGNWDNNWLAGWFPDKGATLTANIHAYNWRRGGETLRLNCGAFSLDEISFTGTPDVMTMGAVSAPASDAFQSTERTKTWEDVTIQQMASSIAGRYGLALHYDAPTIKIASVEQSGATDSAFLDTICKDYGLCIKVYSRKLVIFDRERYKSRAAAATIDKADMLNYSFNTTLAGTYTGGELTYTNSKGKELTYKTGRGPRILKSNVSVSSATEAKLKLDAAIEAANHGETTLSFTTMGNPNLVASQCINVRGLGKADGKYYIDKLTHSLGAEYTTAFECSKVQSGMRASVSVSSGYTRTQFIRDVQSAIGAKVDGIAGPETLSKTPTLSKYVNSKHAAVRPVQKWLTANGYSIGSAGVDGIFGKDTEAAVKTFQQANGCVVDGIITAGNKTWRKLLGL